MYVPPVVATKIEEQSFTPQERFQLCKTAFMDGRRRSIEWDLKRIDPALHDPAMSPPSETETALERDLRLSVEMANQRRVVKNEDRPSSPERQHVIPPFAPITDGVGATSSEPRNDGIQALPSTKLEHALKTAISAAYNAEKYGSELGYVVRFDADAIKSMAITVLINMSEGGRR
jgi:hypothetical protein